ncbi:MAG: hypothetical protein LBE37_14665 [Sphingobacterium sp.]|jgi:CRP-like cAMP-binding protein|nr:hypothetical protein [Sphingobacterium sp.]
MESALIQLRRLLVFHTQEIAETEWKALNTLLCLQYCKEGDRLPTSKGDIYFLSDGVILKTQRTTLTRIIKAEELIFVPLQNKAVHFRALTDCSLLLLSRAELYNFIEQFPRAIRIYDSLLDLWYEQTDERLALLELQKGERIARFKELHKAVYPYMSRSDIANYIAVSDEYLRKCM